MSLGKRLKYLRWKTGNTLSDYSKIFKVSVNTIYRWENDLAVPRKPALKKIADFNKIPVETLLSENTYDSVASDVEKELLAMFREMSENDRYLVLTFMKRKI